MSCMQNCFLKSLLQIVYLIWKYFSCERKFYKEHIKGEKLYRIIPWKDYCCFCILYEMIFICNWILFETRSKVRWRVLYKKCCKELFPHRFINTCVLYMSVPNLEPSQFLHWYVAKSQYQHWGNSSTLWHRHGTTIQW